ncbi:DUF4329 domain-containing protein [Alphaproteobacteria bacterium]|nr:DUF4329 domain-containing protein [Alphaproteobacteria bacterium]
MRMVRSLGAALLALWSFGIATAEDPWESLTFERLDEVAESALSNAQALSLKNNREYCGYIAFDGEDRLRFTAPLKGDQASCMPPEVPYSWELIASYHTHGALTVEDEGLSYEFPSSDDLISDSEEGVDGYLSTPGGRFWFIDTQDEVIIMLGDVGYFKRDSKFEQDMECGPFDEHTFEEIFIMEEEEIGPCDL